MATQSLASPDGSRQLSFGFNLTKYQRIDENGNLEPSPIDEALLTHYLVALCGTDTTGAQTSRSLPFTPIPTDKVLVKR